MTHPISVEQLVAELAKVSPQFNPSQSSGYIIEVLRQEALRILHQLSACRYSEEV